MDIKVLDQHIIQTNM